MAQKKKKPRKSVEDRAAARAEAAEESAAVDELKAERATMATNATDAVAAGSTRAKEHRRVAELVALLDLDNPTLDDTWAAIDSRRTEDQANRGAYYVPGTFMALQAQKAFKLVKPDGVTAAVPLIPAKASDEQLDEIEADHIAALEAELADLQEKLGL